MRYNPKEWPPWVKIVEDGDSQWALDLTPEMYKPLVAAALSVAKWLVYLQITPPKSFECGFCLHYALCELCPLGRNCTELTLYKDWCNANSETKKLKAAAKLHKHILKIYEAEYKKVIG